ncbi:putative methyltransferase tdiE [Colletotrichum spinosum]|uniref:Putative methyltransferase tdiE n=1 Tax=Colletotrichum spinosum TaxID=1347390 RepID=A0A4R8PZ07_9PEZI|nr:putative methyltransferase tdiE [Colletotrichum spinosum]
MSAPEQVEQQPPQVIAAEETQTDDDTSSVGGSSFDDSLASLRSSIVDYRRENGRTYHRLSDGKYLLPNDEKQEQDRLDLQHQLWLVTWDGVLCNCPKKKGAKRVLDIGTGTGIWSIDYAEEHPEATVLGVDLSPIQPEFVPPNCTFEVDDIEKEWMWSRPFDFVFIRNMNSSFTSWEDVFKKAYDNLEPGGYLEVQDHDLPLKCDDGTMTDESWAYKWTQLLVEGGDKMGHPNNVAPHFEQMLIDIGFEDVEVRRERWPMTPWPKDEKHKRMGQWLRANILRGLEAISLALFTRVLDFTREEALVWCAQVREEHKKLDVHGYYDIYAVWGRKPLKEASEAPQ